VQVHLADFDRARATAKLRFERVTFPPILFRFRRRQHAQGEDDPLVAKAKAVGRRQ
jgi:hypothetical protein